MLGDCASTLCRGCTALIAQTLQRRQRHNIFILRSDNIRIIGHINLYFVVLTKSIDSAQCNASFCVPDHDIARHDSVVRCIARIVWVVIEHATAAVKRTMHIVCTCARLLLLLLRMKCWEIYNGLCDTMTVTRIFVMNIADIFLIVFVDCEMCVTRQITPHMRVLQKKRVTKPVGHKSNLDMLLIDGLHMLLPNVKQGKRVAGSLIKLDQQQLRAFLVDICALENG
mmetsp:Transcript_701/g.1330  ORF Transcript_701/g.1330 Transcript_701/m.1330 type:complete len:226 (-) Transcript_701:166-843(-)